MIGWINLSIFVAMASTQPSITQRCELFDASYTLAAMESEPGVKSYTDCLGSAQQQYGNNSGPFSVAQCLETKSQVLATYPEDRRENISYLIAQIDREHVLLTWCENSIGLPLPAHIEIRPEWPQAQASEETNAKN
ncbi:hypothetical protein [Parasphingorhabdus sp.]|uniref:hypothetical protein n=1 Tax=Parasphingorhabdus sp. TaxID=2709688 RepID=UPI003D2B7345